MTLDPGRYQCPRHHTDLTSLVEEALEEARRSPTGDPARPPFQVIVTCPGAAASGPHTLTCSGTRTP